MRSALLDSLGNGTAPDYESSWIVFCSLLADGNWHEHHSLVRAAMDAGSEWHRTIRLLDETARTGVLQKRKARRTDPIAKATYRLPYRLPDSLYPPALEEVAADVAIRLGASVHQSAPA